MYILVYMYIFTSINNTYKERERERERVNAGTSGRLGQSVNEEAATKYTALDLGAPLCSTSTSRG